MDSVYKVLGVSDFRKLYNPKWFALKNFHCCWFSDSDVLNRYLNFRQQSFPDFLEKLKSRMPAAVKILKYLPPGFVRKYVMKGIAEKDHGPLGWLKMSVLMDEERRSFYPPWSGSILWSTGLQLLPILFLKAATGARNVM